MDTDEDGMAVIRGRLPQEIAALLEKALGAAMDALEEEQKIEQGKDRVDSDRGSRSHTSAEASEQRGRAIRHDSAEESVRRRGEANDDRSEDSRTIFGIATHDSAESSGKSPLSRARGFPSPRV